MGAWRFGHRWGWRREKMRREGEEERGGWRKEGDVE